MVKKTTPATKKVNKSAENGQFVSESFLKKNPDKTYKQTVPAKGAKKAK